MKRQNTFLKMASLSCTKMAEIDRAGARRSRRKEQLLVVSVSSRMLARKCENHVYREHMTLSIRIFYCTHPSERISVFLAKNTTEICCILLQTLYRLRRAALRFVMSKNESPHRRDFISFVQTLKTWLLSWATVEFSEGTLLNNCQG
jgi:hypothetical protein